jgi:hypothetical protein
MDEDGNWNWILLQGWVPTNLVDRIAAIPPPDIANGKDIQVVAGAGTDKFAVAAMYKLFVTLQKIIWKDYGRVFGLYIMWQKETNVLCGLPYIIACSLIQSTLVWVWLIKCVITVESLRKPDYMFWETVH